MDTWIHVDESWVFFVRDRERVCIFPDEDVPKAPRVQAQEPHYQGYFIMANARPDPSRGFDGKIGIWRICVMKTAQRSSKRHKRGDEYESDVNIDAQWCADWYENELIPAIKKKMQWLKS